MEQNLEKPKSKSEKKPYIRSIKINNKDVDFVLKEALYANILDEEMLLDKVAIDYMLDEIALAIENTPSRNHPAPNTVMLSQEKVEDLLSACNQNLSSINGATAALSTKENIQSNTIPKGDSLSSLNQSDVNKSPAINLNKTDLSPANISASTSGEKSKNEEADELDSLKKAAGANDFIKIYKPKYTFDNVYLDPVSKRRIISALILDKEKKRLYEDWGLLSTLKNPRPLVLNFYGPPGTGKSMMAEAIANYLSKDVFLVNYSELEAGGAGETAKNIVKCFKKAKESNSVLIFDEADSFLGKRLTNVTSAADYSINITRSVMLIELEKFDGVVIFTTNFISNYDIAFKRRILASLEFKLPDEKGRAHIWNSHIPKELPLSPGITPMSLAYKYGGTTGADIKDIVLFAAVNCLERGRERLSWEDFDEAYEAVKNRYSVI